MQNGKKCPGELGKHLELCVTAEELNRETYRVEESYSPDRRVVVKLKSSGTLLANKTQWNPKM